MSAGLLLSSSARSGQLTREAVGARSILLIQAALWAGMFAIYFASPVLQMNDSQYSMLTAESILRNHTPDLSSYAIKNYQTDLPFNTMAGKHAYQLTRTNGRLLYGFPHASSFLSLPVVGLMDLAGISPATQDRKYNLEGEIIDQKVLAAFLMASLVITFFRSARLLLDWRWSAVIALGAGLGTQIWSTTSRGMWSNTWEIVLGGLVVSLLLSAIVYQSSIQPTLLATVLSWMFFVRPTGAASILSVTIFIFGYFRRDFLRFAITGVIWFCAFVAYSLRIFGTLVPFYYEPSRAHADSIGLGIFGNLLSPSRGLFVFSPVLLLIFFLLIRHWRSLRSRPLVAASLLAICLIAVNAASFPIWWGGNCYGPRLMSDAIPWFVLLAILAVAAIPEAQRNLRNPAIAIGALLLGVSIIINAHGALSPETLQWNFKQRPLPAAMLDWSRPQFLAGWIN
jgi:hypothetical protein